MSNNFRRKITDLPICNDVNELDTLIGLGTDGNTYRVDKTIIPSSGGGSNYESIIYGYYEYIDEGILLYIGPDNADMNNYATKGGILHIIFGYEFGDLSFHRDFPIVLTTSAYMPNRVVTIHDFLPGIYLIIELTHLQNSNEVECILLTCDESGNTTDDVKSTNGNVVSVYFESVPGLTGLKYTPEE